MSRGPEPKDPLQDLYEQGRLLRVPNAPKTPVRGIRIPDDLWKAAQDAARHEGTDLSTVIRGFLTRYVKRIDAKRRGEKDGEADSQ